MLRRVLIGGAGLALADRCVLRAAEKPARPRRGPTRPGESVIQIWMWGGPAHTDTFDPKPDAGYDYTGPFNKAIPTNVDGIQVSEWLPMLAQHADKYSIIRSMTHHNNGHETAACIVQTGHQPGDRIVYPCVGAVVSLFKGYGEGYQGLIPALRRPYPAARPVLRIGLPRPALQTVRHRRYPNQPRFVVDGIVAEGVSDERQRSRASYSTRSIPSAR